jgi:hypothetical protein
MARAIDPAPAFRRYQDEIWDLMHAGESIGGIEDAIEKTDVSEDHKLALWLLAFSLSDPDQAYYGEAPAQDEGPQGEALGRHLSVVG